MNYQVMAALDPALVLVFSSLRELQELRVTLDRAMNCWEPVNQPAWLNDVSATVDTAIERKKEDGLRPPPQ